MYAASLVSLCMSLLRTGARWLRRRVERRDGGGGTGGEQGMLYAWAHSRTVRNERALVSTVQTTHDHTLSLSSVNKTTFFFSRPFSVLAVSSLHHVYFTTGYPRSPLSFFLLFFLGRKRLDVAMVLRASLPLLPVKACGQSEQALSFRRQPQVWAPPCCTRWGPCFRSR